MKFLLLTVSVLLALSCAKKDNDSSSEISDASLVEQVKTNSLLRFACSGGIAPMSGGRLRTAIYQNADQSFSVIGEYNTDNIPSHSGGGPGTEAPPKVLSLNAACSFNWDEKEVGKTLFECFDAASGKLVTKYYISLKLDYAGRNEKALEMAVVIPIFPPAETNTATWNVDCD